MIAESAMAGEVIALAQQEEDRLETTVREHALLVYRICAVSGNRGAGRASEGRSAAAGSRGRSGRGRHGQHAMRLQSTRVSQTDRTEQHKLKEDGQ